MFKKILVPIDGSEWADKGLDIAVHIAQGSSADIVLVNVAYVPLAVTYSSALRQLADVDLETNPIIEAAMAKHANCGLKLTSKILKSDDVAKSILEEAKEAGCDLIIMGSRGLTGFTEFVMGSVSTKVVQTAKVPVLVVK